MSKSLGIVHRMRMKNRHLSKGEKNDYIEKDRDDSRWDNSQYIFYILISMLLIPKRYTNIFEKYLNELLFVSIYIISLTSFVSLD